MTGDRGDVHLFYSNTYCYLHDGDFMVRDIGSPGIIFYEPFVGFLNRDVILYIYWDWTDEEYESDAEIYNFTISNLSSGIQYPEYDKAVSGISLINYPNPFTRNTMIRYSLPGPVHYELSVASVTGACHQILETGEKPAGDYLFDFSAENLPTSLYFITLDSGKNIVVTASLKVQ
jgi:hypothetical protein